jgi:hypothetical protein
MIQKDLKPELDDPIARKESLRARALVFQHLRKLQLSNLYVVESLEEMFDASVQLYRAAEIIYPLEKYNPHKSKR